MYKFISSILLISVAIGLALCEPTPQDYELGNYLMLDELFEQGDDIRPLRKQVSSIDQYLSETGLDSTSSTDEILSKIDTLGQGDQSLKQAANVISKLRGITHSCDKAGYLALARAYLLLGGEPREMRSTKSPVGHLVLTFAQEHKDHCLPEYGRMYSTALARVDKSVLADLEQMFDEEYRFNLQQGTGIETISFHWLKRNIYRSIKSIKDKIKQMLKGNLKVWQHGLVGNVLNNNKNKDPQYYRDYLVSRCASYNSQLEGVFAPARFDSLTLNGWPRDLCMEEKDTKFCSHWQLYRICLAFTELDRSSVLIPSLTARYYHAGEHREEKPSDPKDNNALAYVAILAG